MKLLILDDAKAVRSRLAETLAEIDGLDVTACASREGGDLQLMLDRDPDVIVVDLQRPGGALDLIRAFKSRVPAPVVIALSSSSSLQYRSACHRAGAEYFFDKVHEQARLVEAVMALRIELAG
jgi:DNA-binding NarL/FixJ family response regulator